MNPEEDPKKTPGIVDMFKNIPRLDINPILPEVVSSAQPIQGIYENIRTFADSPFPLEKTPGFQMFLRKVSKSPDNELIVGIDIPSHQFHERALAERAEGDGNLMRRLIGVYLRSVEVDLSNYEISLEEYEEVRCIVAVYSALTGFFQDRIGELVDIGDLFESHRNKFPDAEIGIDWENPWSNYILQVYEGIYNRSNSCLDTLRLISSGDFLEPHQIEELSLEIAELHSHGRIEKKKFHVLFV